MKSIERYKDAVMQRVEQKKTAHRKAQRRILSVCLPLCLCLAVVSATVFPDLLSVGTDHTPENLENVTDGSVAVGYTAVTIDTEVTHVTVTDTAPLLELYGALQAICNQSDSTDALSSCPDTDTGDQMLPDIPYGGVTAPEMAEEPQSNTGTSNGTSASVRICFQTNSGENACFALRGTWLYDTANQKQYPLTDAQLVALTALLDNLTNNP